MLRKIPPLLAFPLCFSILIFLLIICHHTAISKISIKSGNNIRSSNVHISGFMYEDVDMALLEKSVRRKKIINRTINITLFSLTFLFNAFYFLLAQSLIWMIHYYDNSNTIIHVNGMRGNLLYDIAGHLHCIGTIEYISFSFFSFLNLLAKRYLQYSILLW